MTDIYIIILKLVNTGKFFSNIFLLGNVNNTFYKLNILRCIAGAVAEILDSLDDIEILEESDRLLRAEVLNAVDDHRLRAILEVF